MSGDTTTAPAPHFVPSHVAPGVNVVVRNVMPGQVHWMAENPVAIYIGWDVNLYADGETVEERQRNLRDALLKAAELMDVRLRAASVTPVGDTA